MALLPTYAIDGGKVPAAMLRMVAWVATGGTTGVVTHKDLKVKALPTPGGAVSIDPGGAVISTNYSNSSKQQSYVVANDQAFNLTIPAAGPSGRTDYVYLKVSDPQYSGQVPEDPENAIYAEVMRGTSVSGLGPYILLAKIVMPANATTVTSAMITDLRSVAQPRRQRNTSIVDIGATTHDLTSSTFVDWPGANGGAASFPVPEWATKAIVRCDILEVLVRTANNDGELVLTFGGQPAYTTARRYDEIYNGATSRVDQVIVAEFAIPEAMRGTAQTIKVRARRKAGTGSLRSDAYTTVVWDVEFIEDAYLGG